MYPILFKLGPLTIYSYGFFLALAYLLGTFFFWREGRKRGFKEEKLIDFSVLALISAIVGGRILYGLINPNQFSNNFWQILYFWEGGFAFYGSFFLVFITGIYLIRKWKWDFFQIADIGALAVLVSTILAKIGSFLAGNDYGSVTKFPISVVYTFLEGQRHPVQLYEALFSLTLFAFLFRLYHYRLNRLAQYRSGGVFFYYLLFSSLSRLIFEQLRGDSTYLGPFRLASLFALFVATLSIFGLYYYQFRNFRSDFKNISKHIFGLKVRRPFGSKL